jgi:hypothetical protein
MNGRSKRYLRATSRLRPLGHGRKSDVQISHGHPGDGLCYLGGLSYTFKCIIKNRPIIFSKLSVLYSSSGLHISAEVAEVKFFFYCSIVNFFPL